MNNEQSPSQADLIKQAMHMTPERITIGVPAAGESFVREVPKEEAERLLASLNEEEKAED